jgi:hypothetical protein
MLPLKLLDQKVVCISDFLVLHVKHIFFYLIILQVLVEEHKLWTASNIFV